jgi:hypothetical protein
VRVSRKRWIWLAVLLTILGAIIVGGWTMRDEIAYAHIATGYAAKQTCSCRHVSGRPLDSCLAEFPEDARGRISVVESGDQVRASVLFGAISAEAEFEDGFGCRIVN